jgi:NADH:ubiquinone oxidoreductase subunit 4 (subunit M)
MSLIQLYTLQYFLLKFNLIILFVSSFTSIIIIYFNKLYFFQNFLKFKSSLKFIKLFLLITLLISFFFFLLYSYIYFMYISQLNYTYFLNNQFYVPTYDLYFFNISIDIFGIVILFLAYFIGIISLLALDTRLYFKNIKYIYFIHVFILIVFFFVFSNNILLLFFFYELLLLPSFLIVYQISPSRRAVQASLYFII